MATKVASTQSHTHAHAQVHSQLMTMKLATQRTAEAHLGAFIEQLTVSEEMVTTILDGQASVAVCACVPACVCVRMGAVHPQPLTHGGAEPDGGSRKGGEGRGSLCGQ